jgi:3,4-dihydroxy 2-butanone 4-phosphate synthase/GTP cyclohydrolase II
MRDDGEMARMPDLVPFAEEHGLTLLTVADLIEYRRSQEILVRRAFETEVTPRIGGASRTYRAAVYTAEVEDTEYLALVLGTPRPDEPTLVRVHSASVMRDVFSAAGGTGESPVGDALRMIEEAGQGVLLYVLPRGRASLLDEVQGLWTGGAGAGGTHGTVAGRTDPESKGGARRTPVSPVPVPLSVEAIPSPVHASPSAAARADGGHLRDFGLGAQVLIDLGCGKIRLITNNPRRVVGARGYGLHIVECLPMRAAVKMVPLPDKT